jgi:hypothetical protein
MPAERPHPNDSDDVRAHLLRSVTLLSDKERAELVALIDAALARLDKRPAKPA